MKRRWILIAALAVMMGGCAGKDVPSTMSRQDAQAISTTRIGVYDSRAIAVAWARSRFNTELTVLMADYEQARQQGDTARKHVLERKARALQKRLHLQAFSRAPVDDLLEPIRPRMKVIFASAGVTDAVSMWDARAPRKGVIDVTDLLVHEFEPNSQTLETIRELRATQPVHPLLVHCD